MRRPGKNANFFARGSGPWTNELDLAFETIGVLTKVPNGICYADLKLDPCLEPIRKDPRYAKLLAELAPRD